jgi:hypothetical protein
MKLMQNSTIFLWFAGISRPDIQVTEAYSNWGLGNVSDKANKQWEGEKATSRTRPNYILDRENLCQN